MLIQILKSGYFFSYFIFLREKERVTLFNCNVERYKNSGQASKLCPILLNKAETFVPLTARNKYFAGGDVSHCINIINFDSLKFESFRI